ncbi:MAG TPA: (deoxy)nucleoside triphosphate pyrophosphohydrolase [Oceanospirillales bacterium]|nr:(deoxy)nucleoside triphosphate pyrophosphohydrolase [Oceanospirillales bacterium]
MQTVSRQTDINSTAIHVLVLVLENHQGEILVSKRAKNKPQGDLWEFPGGKAEQGESRQQALKREIKEELNYHIKQAKPLICITHDYGKYQVKLDVWYSQDNNPKVKANENQPLKWVKKSQLEQLQMPQADAPIIKKLQND